MLKGCENRTAEDIGCKNPGIAKVYEDLGFNKQDITPNSGEFPCINTLVTLRGFRESAVLKGIDMTDIILFGCPIVRAVQGLAQAKSR